jgi:hypothetical protein
MVIPVFVDCILALRLYIVYPRHLTPHSLLVLIFAPIILLKLVRVVNCTYYLIRFRAKIAEGNPSIWYPFQSLWRETPCLKIEGFSNMAENWYVLYSYVHIIILTSLSWASFWFLRRLKGKVFSTPSQREHNTNCTNIPF